MENPKITEQIIKEIASIMETQEHLGAEKENYRHNENAVKTYADILKTFKENDFKEKELKLKESNEERLTKEYELKKKESENEFDRKNRELDLRAQELEKEFDLKDRELKLKALEEERLMKELELKVQELKIDSDNKLREDIFTLIKALGSGVAFATILKMILNYEDKGVITTKAFGPFIGQAFRSLLPK